MSNVSGFLNGLSVKFGDEWKRAFIQKAIDAGGPKITDGPLDKLLRDKEERGK